MREVVKRFFSFSLALVVCAVLSCEALAQTSRGVDESEFGPIVRAYLGYLRDQQEVVDDRASRREIDRRYYLRNSNRIRALRQVAIRLARESGNDYLPELEAVAADEFDQLFEPPLPKLPELTDGEVLEYKFRYLGAAKAGRETFYVFARLDPYEQAELRKQGEKKSRAAGSTETRAATSTSAEPDAATRPRRVNSP